MVARRGTIRTELQVEGAEKGGREFTKLRTKGEQELSAIARAFKGLRGNVEQFNQVQGMLTATLGRAMQAWRALGQGLQTIIAHNAELSASMQGLRTSLDSVITNTARGVAEGGHLLATIRGLTTVAQGAANNSSGLGRALDFAFDPARLREFTAAFTSMMNSNPLMATILGRGLEWAMERLQAGGAAPLDRIEDRGEYGANRDTRTSDAIAAARRREQELRAQQRRQRSGSRGGEAFTDWDTSGFMADATQRLIDAQKQLAQQAYTAEQEVTQNTEEQLNEAARLASGHWWENHQRRLEAWQEEARVRVETSKSADDAERLADEKRLERIRGITSQVEGYGGALLTVGSAVADVFGQLASEQAEGSKAAERYKKIQGGILAGIAFVNAAIEVARSIGAYPDVVGIAAHAASAVSYIAAGALALRNLGGTASRPATSSGFKAAPKKESTGAAKGSGAVTNNIIAVGWGNARLARELERAGGEWRRGGLDRSVRGAGGHR